MRKTTIQQIAVISEDTAEGFEKAFNDKIRELQCKYIVDTKISMDGGLRAVIIYEDDAEPPQRTVKDEYHDQGLAFLCQQCPHVNLPKDKRIKTIDCRYDEYGHTRLDRECCEMFYKELKQGLVTPRYIR